jgi:hypothetical protein
MTFDFEERQGDLFQCITPTDSIIIGVSEDMKLANKSFRQKIGNQLSLVQAQKKSVGQVASIAHGQRHVFYLITRQKSYNKPSYSDFEMCCVELRKNCEKLGVLNLALSRELDSGLQEKYVKETLFTVFNGTVKYFDNGDNKSINIK